MPCDNIVTIPIKGLVVASERNDVGPSEGYVTFVRGTHKNTSNDTGDETNDTTYSEEVILKRLELTKFIEAQSNIHL